MHAHSDKTYQITKLSILINQTLYLQSDQKSKNFPSSLYVKQSDPKCIFFLMWIVQKNIKKAQVNKISEEWISEVNFNVQSTEIVYNIL